MYRKRFNREVCIGVDNADEIEEAMVNNKNEGVDVNRKGNDVCITAKDEDNLLDFLEDTLKDIDDLEHMKKLSLLTDNILRGDDVIFNILNEELNKRDIIDFMDGTDKNDLTREQRKSIEDKIWSEIQDEWVDGEVACGIIKDYINNRDNVKSYIEMLDEDGFPYQEVAKIDTGTKGWSIFAKPKDIMLSHGDTSQAVSCNDLDIHGALEVVFDNFIYENPDEIYSFRNLVKSRFYDKTYFNQEKFSDFIYDDFAKDLVRQFEDRVGGVDIFIDED